MGVHDVTEDGSSSSVDSAVRAEESEGRASAERSGASSSPRRPGQRVNVGGYRTRRAGSSVRATPPRGVGRRRSWPSDDDRVLGEPRATQNSPQPRDAKAESIRGPTTPCVGVAVAEAVAVAAAGNVAADHPRKPSRSRTLPALPACFPSCLPASLLACLLARSLARTLACLLAYHLPNELPRRRDDRLARMRAAVTAASATITPRILATFLACAAARYQRAAATARRLSRFHSVLCLQILYIPPVTFPRTAPAPSGPSAG